MPGERKSGQWCGDCLFGEIILVSRERCRKVLGSRKKIWIRKGRVRGFGRLEGLEKITRCY